jgi:hypothetical protein
MSRNREWLVPLTGVAFVLVGIVGFAIGGEPKSADDPVKEIVDFYADNKDSVEIGAGLGVVAGLLLIFFGAYLRKFLRAAAPDDDILPLVAFIGFVVVAVSFAVDGTISISLAEAADDIDPVAVQALQALWDNDFLPIVLGVECFLWATGLSVLRTGVLPKWLGWVMIVLALAGLTPIGFVAAIGSALLVLVLSIMLALRARSTTPAVQGGRAATG